VAADPGFGTVRLFWWAGSVSGWIDDTRVLETIVRTRGLAREAGGSAFIEHCPLPVKRIIDVWGDQPQGMEIMQRIKHGFDPLGIMSPGRFVGRI
jgi:glycolate oxidase FAD binding subunit